MVDGLRRVVPVITEEDGCCWVEGEALYINFRWCGEKEAVRYIVLCTVHEVVEHLLGLGHEVAALSEKIVEKQIDGSTDE